MSKTIASKFDGLLILSVIATVLISSCIITVYLLHRFKQDIHEKDTLHIKGLSIAVEAFIDNAFSLNYQLSINPEIIQAVAEAPTDWNRRVARYQEDKENLQPFGPKSGMPLLVTIQDQYEFVELLFVQDAAGDQAARSFGPLGHRGQRWWFQKFLADGTHQPFFSKSYYSMTGDKPVASAFHGIFKDGRFIGIMGTDINFDKLQALVQNYLNSDVLSAVVIDNEGTIIAHPEKDKIREIYNLRKLTRNVLVKNETGGSVQDQTGHHQTVAVKLEWPSEISRMVEQALSGQSGFLEDVVLEGIDATVYYASVRLPGKQATGNNYAIMLIRDNSSMIRSKIAICVFVPLFTAMTIGILLILFRIKVRNTILTPLSLLATSMKANREVTSLNGSLHSGDELQTLAESYNEMRLKLTNTNLQLSKLNEELEKRVEERTNQLNTANRNLLEDIRKRKKVEEALRESQDRYRSIFETAPDAIAITRLEDGKFLEVNDAFCRLSGFSREEAIGNTPFGLKLMQAPSDRDEFVELLKKKGEIQGLHVQYYSKNGQLYNTLLSAKRLRYGNEESLITIATDISSRIQMEAALRESEEKYRLLTENANDAIFVIQDGQVMFANPKAKNLFTTIGSNGVGWPHLDQIHSEDMDALCEKHQPGQPMGLQPFNLTLRLIDKKGRELWTEFTAVPISWSSKPATLNFVRDVTTQKKLENQFQTAQRMDAIGTLAGGIAHNFNNLLMGIQGNLSIMSMNSDAKAAFQDEISGIERCIDSGANLTKQLLGFARGGKYIVKPVDPNEIVRNSSQLFGQSNKQIQIHEDFEKEAWTVEVDQGQMELVLLNTLVNAGQAMEEGGNLFLQTQNAMLDGPMAEPLNLRPGRYVKISITDTGIGMNKETMQKIFEPFYTTKKVGQGTGLGLASAFGIVKNHGGCIDVESAVGQGTRFDIYLPVSDKPLPRSKAGKTLPKTGEGSILIVDDEDFITHVTQEMLEQLGYSIMVAQSGKQALEIYRQHHMSIDLVILDIVMPIMDGGKVFDQLKAIDPESKVLLSSGYSIDDQAAAILARGCDGFIQKPYDLLKLAESIRSVLLK